jgi:hypothetical protein
MKKKIKCRSNDGLEKCLTIGKIYEVIEEDSMYFIVDDSGDEFWHYKKRFEEIKEQQND